MDVNRELDREMQRLESERARLGESVSRHDSYIDGSRVRSSNTAQDLRRNLGERKKSYATAVKSFLKGKRTQLENALREADTDKDGLITRDEFRIALDTRLGFYPTDSSLFLDALDVRENDLVDFLEWMRQFFAEIEHEDRASQRRASRRPGVPTFPRKESVDPLPSSPRGSAASVRLSPKPEPALEPSRLELLRERERRQAMVRQAEEEEALRKREDEIFRRRAVELEEEQRRRDAETLRALELREEERRQQQLERRRTEVSPTPTRRGSARRSPSPSRRTSPERKAGSVSDRLHEMRRSLGMVDSRSPTRQSPSRHRSDRGDYEVHREMEERELEVRERELRGEKTYDQRMIDAERERMRRMETDIATQVQNEREMARRMAVAEMEQMKLTRERHLGYSLDPGLIIGDSGGGSSIKPKLVREKSEMERELDRALSEQQQSLSLDQVIGTNEWPSDVTVGQAEKEVMNIDLEELTARMRGRKDKQAIRQSLFGSPSRRRSPSPSMQRRSSPVRRSASSASYVTGASPQSSRSRLGASVAEMGSDEAELARRMDELASSKTGRPMSPRQQELNSLASELEYERAKTRLASEDARRAIEGSDGLSTSVREVEELRAKLEAERAKTRLLQNNVRAVSPQRNVDFTAIAAEERRRSPPRGSSRSRSPVTSRGRSRSPLRGRSRSPAGRRRSSPSPVLDRSIQQQRMELKETPISPARIGEARAQATVRGHRSPPRTASPVPRSPNRVLGQTPSATIVDAVETEQAREEAIMIAREEMALREEVKARHTAKDLANSSALSAVDVLRPRTFSPSRSVRFSSTLEMTSSREISPTRGRSSARRSPDRRSTRPITRSRSASPRASPARRETITPSRRAEDLSVDPDTDLQSLRDKLAAERAAIRERMTASRSPTNATLTTTLSSSSIRRSPPPSFSPATTTASTLPSTSISEELTRRELRRHIDKARSDIELERAVMLEEDRMKLGMSSWGDIRSEFNLRKSKLADSGGVGSDLGNSGSGRLKGSPFFSEASSQLRLAGLSQSSPHHSDLERELDSVKRHYEAEKAQSTR